MDDAAARATALNMAHNDLYAERITDDQVIERAERYLAFLLGEKKAVVR